MNFYLERYKRYQYQPWYIKLWRRRYYFLIIFDLIKHIFHKHKGEFEKTICYRLITLKAEDKMGWFYDMEEIKEKMEKMLRGRKAREDHDRDS